MKSFFFDVSPCGLGHFATDVLIIYAKAFLFKTLNPWTLSTVAIQSTVSQNLFALVVFEAAKTFRAV